MKWRDFPLERAVFGLMAAGAACLLWGMIRYDGGDPALQDRLVPRLDLERPPAGPFGLVALPAPPEWSDPFVPDADALRRALVAHRDLPAPARQGGAARAAPAARADPGQPGLAAAGNPRPPDPPRRQTDEVRIAPPSAAPPPPPVSAAAAPPPEDPRFAGAVLGTARRADGAWKATVRPDGWSGELDYIELAAGMDWKFSPDETFRILDIGPDEVRVRTPGGGEQVLRPGGGAGAAPPPPGDPLPAAPGPAPGPIAGAAPPAFPPASPPAASAAASVAAPGAPPRAGGGARGGAGGGGGGGGTRGGTRGGAGGGRPGPGPRNG